MASNQHRWMRNLYGASEPLFWPGKFQAGSSQAIKMGEILELTAGGNTQWVPIDSDFAGGDLLLHLVGRLSAQTGRVLRHHARDAHAAVPEFDDRTAPGIIDEIDTDRGRA